ncbi:MAG TPA: DUF1501 domain-containing protein [Vicinamibacteria bacterium]|nr:DUF1501 domain-containing protein [Vicinamibacteria bacterium]
MVSRRAFLKASGLSVVSFGAVPGLLLRAASAADLRPRGRTLVVLFQRGACDGLNVVVPHGEPAYYSARPSIALARPGRGDGATLDLDRFFGLHPALAPLLPLWSDGRLAAVHAVGSPDPTRSHFDAQDFMESGTPGRKATDDGWMNRHLQATPEPGATPLRAVALLPVLPRSLQGKAPAVSLASVADFGVRPAAGPAVAHGFEGMYDAAVADALHGAGHEAFAAMRALQAAHPAQQAPANGAEYPGGALGNSLRQLAQLIKADLGVELAFAEVGGWDHHVGEGGAQGQLAGRLRELASALVAFDRDLGARMSQVAVVTLTEFGRTVRENGDRGTDHGHGSVSLLVGGGVRGGRVHGRWPGLRQQDLYEGRDLAVTTDFRDLLGELLTRHLGAHDLGAVFPGYRVDARRFPGVVS